MPQLEKAIRLATLLPRHPVEFWDRLCTIGEVQIDRRRREGGRYEPRDWGSLVDDLGRLLDADGAAYAREPGLRSLEDEVRRREQAMSAGAPFSQVHNADFVLARTCYVVCRMVRPATVVETGVAYGVTTAFILQALEANGAGQLHSVDLPPLGKDADRHVGALIPEELKGRWHLHRGPTRRVLPSLLAQVGKVDVFVHDSLHTYRTMRWEFETVQPFLAPGAIVIADDVDGNRAFAEWAAKRPSRLAATVGEEEKPGLLGVSVG